MGSSAEATLFYGYADPLWFESLTEEQEEEDCADTCIALCYASGEEYEWEKFKELRGACELIEFGYLSDPELCGLGVAGFAVTVEWGEVHSFSREELDERDIPSSTLEDMDRVAETLGVRKLDESPRWHIVASYG